MNQDIQDNNPHVPGTIFYWIVRLVIGAAAVVVAGYLSLMFLVEMRSLFYKLTYKPITEEVALERVIPMKTVLPTKMRVISGSDKPEIELRAGSSIKIIAACMSPLNCRVDEQLGTHNYKLPPSAYTPSQVYLIETDNGVKGVAALPETIIGHRLCITKGDDAGDTLLVTGIKKINSKDKYPYEFMVEGRNTTYTWGMFLYPKLDSAMVVYNSPSGDEIPGALQQRVPRVPSFLRTPVHESEGFFLFPRYKSWNMYKILPFFRSSFILLLIWIVLMLIALWRLSSHSFNAWWKGKTKYIEDPSYDNADAQSKVLWLYWRRYYPFAFLAGCLFTPLIWLWTSKHHRGMLTDLRELMSTRCPECHHLSLKYGPSGKETERRFVGHVHKGAHSETVVTGEKYDKVAKQTRQDTVTTHYEAESYDDYEYEVEMKLGCTKCNFCETHWETRHEKRNHEGGGVDGEVRKTWE